MFSHQRGELILITTYVDDFWIRKHDSDVLPLEFSLATGEERQFIITSWNNQLYVLSLADLIDSGNKLR